MGGDLMFYFTTNAIKLVVNLKETLFMEILLLLVIENGVLKISHNTSYLTKEKPLETILTII